MNSGKYTPIRLAISIVCSLVAGFCAASLYATFRHGFTGEAMMTFSVFAFLYEAPPYLGYASPIFYHGLAIIFATSAFILLCQLFLSMRDPEHHGTARWAGVGEMRYAGYLQRYSRIKGPIFGKICGPRWFGSYLTNGDQPHSLIVAPTRAGKGVGVVIPTLLTFQGSVIALDVKGELLNSRRERVNRAATRFSSSHR